MTMLMIQRGDHCEMTRMKTLEIGLYVTMGMKRWATNRIFS